MSCFDAFGPLICFSTVTHLIPPTTCLSFDVSMSPSEFPRSHQRGVLHGGRKQECLARESHFRTSHSLALYFACSFCLSQFGPALCTPNGKEKETAARAEREPSSSYSSSYSPSSAQLPAASCSLVSTRRGTMRIHNSRTQPKPRNAPLSAPPSEPPVCYVKVPAGCQSRLQHPGALRKETRGQRGKTAGV